MRLHLVLSSVAIGALLGACALQQPPANVVSGIPQKKTVPPTYGPVANQSIPGTVSAASEPPVLLEPSANVAVPRENISVISPAAGPETKPDVKPLVVAAPAVKEPAPMMISYTVLPSDTAFKIARKYNTSVDRILKDNGLTSMTEIRDGQTLTIAQNSKPQNSAWDDMKRMLNDAATPQTVATTTTEAKPSTPIVQADAVLPKAVVDIEPAAGESPQLGNRVMPEAVKPVKTAAGAEDTGYVKHTVAAKETIYRISRQYNVSVLDIMAANDFSEPQDLKADTVIRVPVKTDAAVKQVANVAPAAGGEPVQVAMLTKPEVKDDATPEVEQPKVTAAKEAVVSKDELKMAEHLRGQVDPVAAQSKGLVWPVKGKIVKRFGDDGHGVAETGINIAVPNGTSVLASEGGTVLYADDGLKIYGKLVLIRHDNGMVSAYAHNGYLLVKKGERVKKGQIIALSGASGNVDTPQLHFELRQHASAMDPIAMLPRL